MEFISMAWGNMMGAVGALSAIVFRLASSAILEVVNADVGTFTRATTATVIDHENVIREVQSGEVRFQLQRRVENLLTASEDLTAAVWADSGGTTRTTDTITFNGTSGQYIRQGNDFPSGGRAVFSVEMKATSALTVGVAINDSLAWNTYDTDMEVILTTEWVRYSFGATSTGTGHARLLIGDIDKTGSSIGGITGTISVRNVQLQDKTGASDPTIPDSYVSTGVLSAPYHGTGVDGTKVFLSTNGNSVASNVVTEASGTPITDAIGYFGEPASTNKCTNYNANPDSGAVSMGTLAAFNAAGVTGVAAGGGDGSTLFGVVDDATALAAAGLDGICTDNLVLKIDNSSGTGVALFRMSGAVANTNTHSISGWVRVDSGDTATIALSGNVGIVSTTSTSFVRVSSENITPPDGTRQFDFRVDTGFVGYFILNQLEEKAFSTSEIITEGSAVTRNKDDMSYPSTNIPINDCVFTFDWTPTAAGQGTVSYFSSGSATDEILLYYTASSLRIRKRVSSTNYDVTTAFAYSAGTTYSLKVRLDSSAGIDMWIDDSKGSNNSNTLDISFPTDLFIGSYYDGSLQQTGGINNFVVYSGGFTDAEVQAL